VVVGPAVCGEQHSGKSEWRGWWYVCVECEETTRLENG
jgi:hypothetical protein